MSDTVAIIKRAQAHSAATAIREDGGAVSYAELLERSLSLAALLLEDRADLREERIALLIPPGADYVVGQWAIWRAGGVVVPLCLGATEREWAYTLENAEVSRVVCSGEFAPQLDPLIEGSFPDLRRIQPEKARVGEPVALPSVGTDRRAMILYTSGTTSRPKGVVSTHANLIAQIEMLVEAWAWESQDSIPLFLPLHHIHGIVNVLGCGLWSGATIETFRGFSVERVFERVRARAYSVFMAVPTIYVKMIEALERLGKDERSSVLAGFGAMRLMVSGSAALPASVHEAWTALTGQELLERYGMTEIGMALSNPLNGERRPGAVGQALPGVSVRLKTEAGDLVAGEDEAGEIQVRGAAVFQEYWRLDEVTKDSFDAGWFRTGDVAVLERGAYRIMGRLSVDIIKSGGYKLSALEIEAALLDHPGIAECAVVGLPDETWGEAVGVALVAVAGENLSLETLREWGRERLSVYKLPKHLLLVDHLPRNAMGKVTKGQVKTLFGSK